MERLLFFFYALSIFYLGGEVSGAQKKTDDFVVEKIGPEFMVFKSKKKIKTFMPNARLIERVKSPDGTVYLLLIGSQCQDCDAGYSIYIHRPVDGDMESESTQKRYLLPGKLFDYEDRSILSETRVFYGRCLKSEFPVVVWTGFNVKEKNQKEYFFGVVNLDGTKPVWIDRTADSKILEQELSTRLASKNCKEIPGEDHTSEP